MKRYQTTSIICLLLPIIIVSLHSPLMAAPPRRELAGRAVSMELVTDNDALKVVAWPAERIMLITKTVTARRDSNIDNLLRAHGIRPDVESYTLIYDLNPNLESLDRLPEGTKLVLPSVKGGPRLRQKLKSGHIVMLNLDKGLKDRLAGNVVALRSLSMRFAALSPVSLPDPGKQKDSINAVRESVDWLTQMQETIARRSAKPIRIMTLRQMVNESDILRSILEAAIKPGRRLSAADQAQIFGIHDDLEELLKRWDEPMAGGIPPGEPQYKIVVEIRGKDSATIRNLRVYYVERGLFRTPIVNPPVRYTNFSGLGSGSWAVLPVKNYKVWAARDGDPTNPITNPQDLLVRAPQPGDAVPPLVLLVR
jgi:hypothetical protein